MDRASQSGILRGRAQAVLIVDLILAYIIDLMAGDPVYRYHPARLMGQAISRGEDFLRAQIRNERTAGAVLAFSFPLLVFIALQAVILALSGIHPILGLAANVFGIYSALSVRDLQVEGERILMPLENKNLPEARLNAARIVGRDTDNLDEKEVTRAAVEAVAESTVDGIISPLFFAALGGAPLALAYKAVNTLDSMIGHQNERYKDFGFFAAKLDEVWNWIPARLSLILATGAVFIMRGRTRETWEAGVPFALVFGGNSAVPEAAFAGALGVQLGGPSTYQGRLVEKPFLGTVLKELEISDLRKSLQLMMVVSGISLVMALALRFMLQ